MKGFTPILPLACGILPLADFAVLGETAGNYSLLHPTPRDQMREMSTDRPDKTESPYTVDAGHFQVEMDLVNFSYDRHNDSFSNTRVESWSLGTANVKIGLCPASDFQLVVPLYNHIRTTDFSTGTVTKNSGFGDLVARLKLNLWGNDGGDTALAVMPFLKMPSNQDGLGNKACEGGVIIPLAVALPGGWGMGLMTEFDFNEDRTGGDYHPEFVNSITLAHQIVGNLGGYVEFFSSISTESGSAWVGTADLGFSYALTDNIQLDGGINMGLTRSADDWNPFVGMSWRF